MMEQKTLKRNNMKTIGERRVRTDFNASASDFVAELKNKGAEFINLIDNAAPDPKLDEETFKEYMRLKALAMTAIEEGTMYAVKMETTTP